MQIGNKVGTIWTIIPQNLYKNDGKLYLGSGNLAIYEGLAQNTDFTKVVQTAFCELL